MFNQNKSVCYSSQGASRAKRKGEVELDQYAIWGIYSYPRLELNPHENSGPGNVA